MEEYVEHWGMAEDYMPMVFVCLGYIDGDYPKIKPRNQGRTLYISKK